MQIPNIQRLTTLPTSLQYIPDPPGQLFYCGSLAALEQPCLAVVGSRKVSSYGRSVTANLVEAVAARGITIISGLALGVDGLAHRAALKAGGLTVAVLAGGLDKIYPASHFHLAQEILRKGGGIVSEYPMGSASYKYNFVARNRLVSGLSQAVLITEASERSGSLHTSNFALEQGRDVLAVPGNITSDTSVGANNLIKTGATPILGTQDLLDYFELDQQQVVIRGSNREEQVILDLLATGTSSSAELLQASQLDLATFNQTLTMLEITGRIRSSGTGQWSA